jgi:hypothetical protein
MYVVDVEDVFEKSQSASLSCDWHKVAMRRHERVASEHMVNFIRRKATFTKASYNRYNIYDQSE